MLYQLSYVRVQASLARRRGGRLCPLPLPTACSKLPRKSSCEASRADFRALADDDDGRTDVHVLEQPLRVGDVHPDATVRR